MGFNWRSPALRWRHCSSTRERRHAAPRLGSHSMACPSNGAQSLFAQGHGCTFALALRFYNAVALARVTYTAAVASLSACQLATLNVDHHNAVPEYYELAHNSQAGPMLAEAGKLPFPKGDTADTESCTAT
ncbi:hypothetical protein MRX96_020240 [Rhipicephalus microplus]